MLQKFHVSIVTTYNYWFTYQVMAENQIKALRIARKLASQIDKVHRFFADPY